MLKRTWLSFFFSLRARLVIKHVGSGGEKQTYNLKPAGRFENMDFTNIKRGSLEP